MQSMRVGNCTLRHLRVDSSGDVLNGVLLGQGTRGDVNGQATRGEDSSELSEKHYNAWLGTAAPEGKLSYEDKPFKPRTTTCLAMLIIGGKEGEEEKSPETNERSG